MTIAPGGATLTFDPSDAAFLADPFPSYRALREQAPVHRAERGYWVITRYGDVFALLGDPRVRLAEKEPPAGVEPAGRRLFDPREVGRSLVERFIYGMGRDDHRRVRRAVLRALSPARATAWREQIQAITDDRIDAALPQGRMDVVTDLAQPVTFATIADQMGIPDRMRKPVAGWARDLSYTFELDSTPSRRERGSVAVAGLASYLRAAIAGDGAVSGEASILADLMQARSEGHMSEDELLATGVFLFFAGRATTEHLIGNALLALLRHPEQLERLRSEPSLLDSAIEECIRYDTPTPVVPRVAREDIGVAGQAIREGEGLLLVLASADRDPEVFEKPDRLDVARSPNPHIGFGRSSHRCPGAGLGKIVVGIVIGTLLRRIPDLTLEPHELEWGDRFDQRGLRSLRVAFG